MTWRGRACRNSVDSVFMSTIDALGGVLVTRCGLAFPPIISMVAPGPPLAREVARYGDRPVRRLTVTSEVTGLRGRERSLQTLPRCVGRPRICPNYRQRLGLDQRSVPRIALASDASSERGGVASAVSHPGQMAQIGDGGGSETVTRRTMGKASAGGWPCVRRGVWTIWRV